VIVRSCGRPVLTPKSHPTRLRTAGALAAGAGPAQPTLTPGAIVTTHKNVVDKIVREHGVAELRGRTIRQRAARRDDTGLPRRRLHRPASLQESLDTI
jgi:hypothetical protein